MYFGATCGTRRRRSAERNSEWKSSQWAACSKYGFMPGNGDGRVHILGALSDEEPCAFLPASARLEDNTKGLPSRSTIPPRRGDQRRYGPIDGLGSGRCVFGSRPVFAGRDARFRLSRHNRLDPRRRGPADWPSAERFANRSGQEDAPDGFGRWIVGVFRKNPVGAIGRAGAYGGCLSWAVFDWETPAILTRRRSRRPDQAIADGAPLGLVGRHHDDDDVQVERVPFMKDRIEPPTGGLGLSEILKVKCGGKIGKGHGSEDEKRGIRRPGDRCQVLDRVNAQGRS